MSSKRRKKCMENIKIKNFMKKVQIKTIEKIVNYIGTKAHSEVESIINSIIREYNSEENKFNNEKKILSIDLLEKIFKYLSTKPFLEVDQLLKTIVSEVDQPEQIEIIK